MGIRQAQIHNNRIKNTMQTYEFKVPTVQLTMAFRMGYPLKRY